MKWLIASDLHGSAYWCRKLLEAREREQSDRILFLGDILYHGPRNDLPRDYAPKQVIEMLSPLREELLCVRGNCDGEVDQMVLPFPVLAEYALLAEGRQLIFATHGHHWHAKCLPPVHEGDILLHGHTHVPCNVLTESGVRVLNPGSLSLPKEDSWHGYMTLDNGLFLWKDTEGNERMRFEMCP